MTQKHCVGTVKGPGETPHEFTFIAPDPERRVKHGEFVYYETTVDGEEKQILGRVTGRVPVKLFPDSFMADPSVSPESVAMLLGYDSDARELFQITVTVLGFYDDNLGDFINPRVPPQGGAPVYIAEDELLAAVLSRGTKGQRGSAYIGDLLRRLPGAVPVALSVKGFTSTHLAIIASTGSGKSYLAGVLLEELMMPYNRAAVLVVDPHGEYGTLQKDMPNLKIFEAGNYKPPGAPLPARSGPRAHDAPYYVGATLGREALADALSSSGLAVMRTGHLMHAPRLAAVVLGSVVEQRLGDAAQERFAGALRACEGLGRLPTRSVSGHFVAALAERPQGG